MEDSRESLIAYLKEHTPYNEFIRYQLIEITDFQIKIALHKQNILTIPIYVDESKRIYLLEASDNMTNTLRNFKGYQLYTFNELEFLQLAKFFIECSYNIMDVEFLGDDLLISFTIGEQHIRASLYRSGMLYTNTDLTTDMTEFFTIIKKQVYINV